MPNIVTIIIIIAVFLIKRSAKLSKTQAREGGKRLTDTREERDIRQSEKRPVEQVESIQSAYTLWKDGNQREALKLLNAKDALRRGSVNELILMGEIYFEMHDYDKASLAFNNSIRKGATSYAYSRLGEIAEANELYKDGIKYFKKALSFKDSKKGYIYHQLGDLYMYVGDDDKSNAYFEKAEVYHAEGHSTKLATYDFLNSSNTKNSTNPIGIIVLLVLLFTGFVSFFIFKAETSYTTNEVMVEEAVLDEVEVEVKEEKVELDIVKIYDRAFGNTNSNIYYGGYVLPFEGQTFAVDYDNIILIDEVNDTEEVVFEALAPAYINFMDDTFYYISYGEDSLLTSFSKADGFTDLEVFEYPRDLIVDPYYLYVIEDTEPQIFYIRKLESDSFESYETEGLYSVAQTEDRLYFHQYDDICYLDKDNLLNLDNLENHLEYIVFDVQFMTIEGNYMFYLKGLDLYRKDLEVDDEHLILTDIDIQFMSINAYQGELYVAYDNEVTYTDVYDFDGNYIGTIEDYFGNQISNDYVYWY